MKRMLLAIFSTLCLGATAQPVITNATFPVAGDTLMFATDVNPAGIDFPGTAPGGNQIWDFSKAVSDSKSSVVYKNASGGTNAAQFPGAELVVSATANESYFNITSDKFENMGFFGKPPGGGFNLNLIARYKPAIIERYAPTQFFDIRQQTSDLSLPFSTAQLPDSLFQGFPKPDSVRVRFNSQRLEVIDGYGECKIPGGQYSVLRQKRTEYNRTSIDIYLGGLFGWLDLCAIVDCSSLGGPLGNLVGIDTVLSYRFYSPTEKEEIAVATLNSQQNAVQSLRFKDNMVVATETPEEETDAPGSASIKAFPNPAVEWVRFDCFNLNQDRYTLKIFNIIGKSVWQQEYLMSGNKSIKIELQDFKKGTYLYSLTDSKGNIIGTKRLVILKP